MIKSKLWVEVKHNRECGIRRLCWLPMNNGWHVKTSEKSANTLFMEFVRSALKSNRTVSCGCGCFLFCFSEEREECTWNHKMMDDTVFWCRRENTTTRPEPETEDSGTPTSTDDNIFADFFGSYWITKGRPNEWFTARWPVKSSRSLYISDWFEMVMYDIEQCNRMRLHDLKFSGRVSLRSKRMLLVHLYECRPSLPRLWRAFIWHEITQQV